jgi:hypothetical protein
VVFAASGSLDDPAHQSHCHLCNRAIVPACHLFPPAVQVRPVFILSSSATLFLCRQPSIDSTSLHRETVHEQEAREGARDTSLMDVAEERVGLYTDAIETGREQSYCMSVTFDTSVLKDRQGDENGLSCSAVARSTKETSDGFVGHAVISGHLVQGFVVFHDTADHVGPFFRWDAMVRLTWTRILL